MTKASRLIVASVPLYTSKYLLLLEPSAYSEKNTAGGVEGHLHNFYTNCADLNCAVEMEAQNLYMTIALLEIM